MKFIPFGIFAKVWDGVVAIILRNKPKQIEYYEDGTIKKITYR